MKTIQQKDPAPRLAGDIQIARLRLEKAESKLVAAKERSRLARQRRKAAKLAARRAKKRARLAKQHVAHAKLVLTELEARIAATTRSAVPRTPVKARRRKTPSSKAATILPRLKSTAQTAAAQPRRIPKIKRTVARKAKTSPAANPITAVTKFPATMAPELETPVEVLPLSEHKPTQEIVRGVEEIFTEDPVVLESSTPAAVASSEQPTSQQLTANPQETS